MILKTEADLLELIPALRAAGGLTRRLHRRQQERDQDANDGNDKEQLNKGECVAAERGVHGSSVCPGGNVALENASIVISSVLPAAVRTRRLPSLPCFS